MIGEFKEQRDAEMENYKNGEVKERTDIRKVGWEWRRYKQAMKTIDRRMYWERKKRDYLIAKEEVCDTHTQHYRNGETLR